MSHCDGDLIVSMFLLIEIEILLMTDWVIPYQWSIGNG